jgi:membrane associated rhomboid family serine protease
MSFGPPLTPMVKKLIIAMGVVFALTYIPGAYFGIDPLDYMHWFALSPYYVVHRLYLWQLATYLFLHGGWFHIIFNLFALWMFGSDLEALWGGRKFLTYFFVTGIGAGIFDVVLNTIFRAGVPIFTIGCSGAIFGLLLAYGMLFPERVIYLYMIVPVKAKWFVVIIGAIEFFSSFSSGSGISHFAHLGGLLFGYLFMRGAALPFRWRLSYQDWRRAQTRKKFEVYMRDHEKKDDHGRWVN